MSILSVKIAAKLSGAVFASGSRRDFPSRRRAPRVPALAFDSRRSRGIIGTAAML